MQIRAQTRRKTIPNPKQIISKWHQTLQACPIHPQRPTRQRLGRGGSARVRLHPWCARTPMVTLWAHLSQVASYRRCKGNCWGLVQVQCTNKGRFAHLWGEYSRINLLLPTYKRRPPSHSKGHTLNEQLFTLFQDVVVVVLAIGS
jgi:hypothetical protein